MITKATLLQIFDAADLLTCDVVAGTVDQEISITDGEFKLKDSGGFDVLFETYVLSKSSDLGIVQS